MIALGALPLPRWWGARTELRIDVELPGDALERELERLHARLHAPDGRLACRPLPALVPGFVFHYREADGEFFVYVEDAAKRRLAGSTVFNRVVELDRQADRVLRGPHSRYARRYQGLGLATAVYEWALGAGLCLISGPRQSAAAHRLWRRLERRGHPLHFVQLLDRRLRFLGEAPEPAVVEDFHTRMVLLGCGCGWGDVVPGQEPGRQQALARAGPG